MAVTLKSTRNSADSTVKCLVYGQAGAGKTVLCASAPKPIILSAESGLLSLRSVDIPYIEIGKLDDLHEAYAFVAESSEFQTVCLDSVTEIAEIILSAEKKIAKDPRQAYGALQDQMTDLLRAFRDLPNKHVYFSAKMERIKDELSGRLAFAPSMPGNKLAQAVPYFFDEVFCLRVENDPEGKPQRWLQTGEDAQYLAKDRAGNLDMFEPADLQFVFNKILNQE